MLDIKLLRNNFEEVEKALSTRNEDFDLSKFKSMDEKRRQLLAEVEQLKNKQNVESKKIPQMKKAGEDIAPVMEEMKKLSDSIKVLDAQVSASGCRIKCLHADNPKHPESNGTGWRFR